MFTGLIQQVGKLAAKKEIDGALRLIVRTQVWNPPLIKGESIAVNGVCLTVAQITEQGFGCDVLEETIRCSNLNTQPVNAPLNLERAVRVGESLGGHLITGHVEGLGTLARRMNIGRDWRLDFSCDPALLRRIVPKGSIACDGISLTVAAINAASFSVNIIPFTWANTNLCRLRQGDKVNLETDLIGKYVFRWLEQNQRSSPFANLPAPTVAGFATFLRPPEQASSFAKATVDRSRRREAGAMGDREIRGQQSEEKSAGSITEDDLRKAGFMEATSPLGLTD